MKRILLSFFLPLLLFAASSCKKLVEVSSPKDQLTADKVFGDSTNAQEAVLGTYVQMMQAYTLGFTSGGLTAYPGLSADELYLSAADNALSPFYANHLTPANSTNGALWQSAYSDIYSVNACIEGISASAGISPAQRQLLTGECRCLRAFLYFQLVNLYGGVPLVLTTTYQTNRVLGRASTDAVYQQIMADLQAAQQALSPTTVATERAGYWAATGLLAKVALYRGDYAGAKTAADLVIGSGHFQLMADLNGVFLATSTETIWRLLPVVPGKETWEGYYFVPSSATATPKFVVSPLLLQAFEPGDLRRTDWTDSTLVSGQAYAYPYKYKLAATAGSATESYVVLRLAEQYLIRAEARAQLNDLPGALSDLNQVRARAGLPGVTVATQAAVLRAVAHERQTELFCEWGNRWFDLKRTHQADVVLSVEKSGWTSNAQLYPIPQVEINANPSLTQNPGY